jgi:ADP-ribose pyrophosphatase YjhB (NUDIX family)
VAVDIALLSPNLDDKRLEVAEMWREDTQSWALPGAFLREGETLADAVRRCLHDKLGVHGIRLRQLEVFDDPYRDERDWVLSVAHVAVVRPEQLRTLGTGSATRTRMAPADRPGTLAWDHADIVRLAKNNLRRRYQSSADPEHLLRTDFTMRELRRIHEAVEGDDFKQDAFRRAMAEHVVSTGRFEGTGSRGRPAELFGRAR